MSHLTHSYCIQQSHCNKVIARIWQQNWQPVTWEYDWEQKCRIQLKFQLIANWKWVSEGCGNVGEKPIRSWRQNRYFRPLCVRVCARVRRYVCVSLCVCVWVCVRVGWLWKTGRILWMKTSGSWSNLWRLVKCACLPNVQFQMNICVPLTLHDSILWICSVYVHDVLLVHVTMTLRRVYSVTRSSHITHNKTPAIFEDYVGAHERSQIQFGHEAIHAITWRNFTTGGNFPGSNTAHGESAFSIIPNPRRQIMYIHTSEYHLLSLMPSGRCLIVVCMAVSIILT